MGDPLAFDWSPAYLLSLLYLTVFGSILTFAAFLELIGRIGPARASDVGVMVPIVALVDTDPSKVGRRVGDLAIEPLDSLDEIVTGRGVAIGVIAVPAPAAQEVADRLVAAGVSSILNFAPAVVSVPPHVSMRKVDLATELQILSFYQQHRIPPSRVACSSCLMASQPACPAPRNPNTPPSPN